MSYPRMAQQQVRERHWCTIPHTSLSSTCVVKGVKSAGWPDLGRSLTLSACLWQYVPIQIWYPLLWTLETSWNSSGNSFQRSSRLDSRYPMNASIMQVQPILSLHSFDTKPLCNVDLTVSIMWKGNNLHSCNGKLTHFCRLFLLHLGIWKMYVFTHA